MTNIPIHVTRTNDRKYLIPLNPDETLTQVRAVLQSRSHMNGADRFFTTDGVQVDLADEDSFKLSVILKDEAFTVGLGSGADQVHGDDASQDELKTSEKADLLYEKCELLNGYLTKTERGEMMFTKGASRVMEEFASLPKMDTPQQNMHNESFMSFSKFEHEMDVQGVNTTSVSFSSPFGGADASISNENDQNIKTSESAAYFTLKRFVPKAAVTLSEVDMIPSSDFTKALATAVKTSGPNGYEELINALNTYGYYVGKSYTLGGAYYVESRKEYASRSEAVLDKSSFEVSAKAEYEGFGGGASHKEEKQTTTTESSEKETFSMSVSCMGGNESLTENKDHGAWMDSLKDQRKWRTILVSDIIPTLALLAEGEQDLFQSALGLIQSNLNSKISTTPQVIMSDYAVLCAEWRESGWD